MVRNKVAVGKFAEGDGEFRLISKQDLNVDHSYQRDVLVGSKHRKRFEPWSWELCGSLIIAERSDKSLWIVDGLQRYSAAIGNDLIVELPCMVFQSEGPQAEAWFFNKLAKERTGIKPVQEHKARLKWGDEAAWDIENLVLKHGYAIAHSSAIDSIKCIHTIYNRYARNPKKLNSNALKALELSIQISGGKYQIQSDLFVGLECLLRNKVFLDGTALQKLSRASEYDIAMVMKKSKAILSTDGGRAQAEALLAIANKGRQKGNQIHLPGID